MIEEMIDNPFVTNGYAGPEYFCDRVEETALLTNLLTNGNNVALMSPRRIGKTDLMKHCFQQDDVRDNYYCFIIDIYATNSLRDFVNMFGKSILEALKPKGRKVWESFLSTLLSVRSEISFDINGNPVWGLGVGSMTPPQTTLDEIFAYLRSADKHCLVAIDEFQQILYYTDRNVEAALRTQIQQCPNANFTGAPLLSVGSSHEPLSHLVGAVLGFRQSTVCKEWQPAGHIQGG